MPGDVHACLRCEHDWSDALLQGAEREYQERERLDGQYRRTLELDEVAFGEAAPECWWPRPGNHEVGRCTTVSPGVLLVLGGLIAWVLVSTGNVVSAGVILVIGTLLLLGATGRARVPGRQEGALRLRRYQER
ncbi:hypothetical protein ACFSC4_20855 [Deinococcus malanensis]|uniref:hypothetical protein n=1 Tax=Deinococcus malanensis TaxID=1706855 RepID=UPI003630B55B